MALYIKVISKAIKQLGSSTPPSMGVTLQSVYEGVVYFAFTLFVTMVKLPAML